MDDRWLSVDEIADYLGVAKDTIYTWVASNGTRSAVSNGAEVIGIFFVLPRLFGIHYVHHVCTFHLLASC